MSKRRLSQQQQARIAEKQQRELVSEFDDSNAADVSKCNGRVISHFGQQVDIEPLPYQPSQPAVRCFQRANLPPLVTGDLVVWESGEDDTGVVVAVGQRASVFGRPAFDGNFKPMAANIDRVLIVIAPIPEPFPNLIDRYLAAIETLNLEATLVLNKVDLHDGQSRPDLDNMLSIYQSIGYPVHKVSASEGVGFAALQQDLAGQTTVLVGQSGVGKSSLINRLSEYAVAAVGPLSEAKPKGTHTTTTAKLFHLADFDLIDSPGIREFSLGHIEADRLFNGFREFRPFAGCCKFRDCKHQSEPGCALLQATAAGTIHPQRLESYFQILQTLNTGRGN